MRITGMLSLVLVVWITPCDGHDARAERPDTGRVLDRLLPRDAAVRRFHEGLPPAHTLGGAAESRDALVGAFLRALGAADTATIADLAITRAEFGYLYYPTATEALPPYDMDPELMWFLLFEKSNQGIRRALQLYGGRPMRLVDYDCGTGIQREGENTVHGPCVVRWRGENGDTVAGRLFSQILERGGRFKFLSYANKLD
jgi:hypothetical protein